MPKKNVKFNENWYNDLIGLSNEKHVLVDKIKCIVSQERFHSCLEIGLGTTTHFIDSISSEFSSYTVVEKEDVRKIIPTDIAYIHQDWEDFSPDKKFDVIIASHVIYYFKDRKKSVEKMLNSLNQGGILILVVNGKDGDYGPLKQKFAELIGIPYSFTYDTVKDMFKEVIFSESSVPSELKFSSPEELFEGLKITFDMFPDEYEEHKQEMLSFYETSYPDNKMIINQKIFVCKNE